MIEAAASQSAFGIVVVIAGVLGIVVALVIGLRHRDAFARERGSFWMFHGDADTSPHQMPGARFEERHVIDPEVPAEAPRPAPLRSTVSTAVRRGRKLGHSRPSRRATRS
jgi:hypothetical protein